MKHNTSCRVWAGLYVWAAALCCVSFIIDMKLGRVTFWTYCNYALFILNGCLAIKNLADIKPPIELIVWCRSPSANATSKNTLHMDADVLEIPTSDIVRFSNQHAREVLRFAASDWRPATPEEIAAHEDHEHAAGRAA